MANDEILKKRRQAILGARISGAVILGVGIAIGFSDFWRPEGAPEIGALVGIVGIMEALLAPLLFQKAFEPHNR